MASVWQKTLFYLGLVDEDDAETTAEAPPPPQSGARTVEPPRPRSARPSSTNPPPPPSAPQPMQPRTSGSVAGRRIEPPSTQRRRQSSNPQHAEAGVLVQGQATTPLPSTTAGSSECEIIEASTFTDAQVLADHIRAGRPVVLDLRLTEPAMVRRLIDFATGLTYALDGRMAKTAQGVILVTPQGRALDASEQDRLTELGLYRVSA